MSDSTGTWTQFYLTLEYTLLTPSLTFSKVGIFVLLKIHQEWGGVKYYTGEIIHFSGYVFA